MKRVLVTGASGFLGGHLTEALGRAGARVRTADLVPQRWKSARADERLRLDLRDEASCRRAARGVQEVWHLAGGRLRQLADGRDEAVHLRNEVLLTANMLEAARLEGVERFLVVSSPWVYPLGVTQPPAERASHPVEPQGLNGWADAMREELARRYQGAGIEVRVARLGGVYGPQGPYEGEAASLPARLCQQVAEARIRRSDQLKVRLANADDPQAWMYVDDAIRALRLVMDADAAEPMNVAAEEALTEREYLGRLAVHVGLTVQGVAGGSGGAGLAPCLDTRRLREVTGFRSRVTLQEGLRRTYSWVESNVRERGARCAPLEFSA